MWEEKCLICVFWGYNLKIQSSYLKSSNLSYWTGILKKLLIAKFHEKIKMPKSGTKNALFFGIFGLKFEENIVIFEISVTEFVL